MQNYYELLGVPNNAAKSEVKRAYRRLALRWHPDKNPTNLLEASKRFKEICEAYEILFDDRKRRIYDDERYRRAFNHNKSNSTSSVNSHQSSVNSFNRFSFKPPHEIFREEFGDESPKYYESMDPPMNYCTCYHGPNDMPHRNFMAFMRDPFTNMKINFPEQPEVKKASAGEPRDIIVTTKIVDGRKIVTKKFRDNNGETILLYENGKLISKTFNC